RMMERSDSDAVAEFLDYQDVRTKLRRVEAPAANLAARVGDRYVMRFPSGELNAQQAAELVGQLDHAVPETLATLAQDADFVSLLESLRDPDDQRELREKVAGRVLTGTTAAEQPKMTATTAESATTTADLTALGGAHVVWIDDNPAATEREAGALREAGCRVEQFSDVADALPIVASDPPDVLVSDVTRGDRPYAGFDDLQRLRTEAGYEGPAVFYVARLSADRRDMATTLGATITSDMVELLRLVGEAHRPPPPEPTGRFKAREDGAPIPQ
ncbi:MAG: hypothetical protein JHC95_22430, partial [Solirubrobacteraceae bacterium]|nr:hypothetical protein [Solirubrobacteraceae bacterium]